MLKRDVSIVLRRRGKDVSRTKARRNRRKMSQEKMGRKEGKGGMEGRVLAIKDGDRNEIDEMTNRRRAGCVGYRSWTVPGGLTLKTSLTTLFKNLICSICSFVGGIIASNFFPRTE